ncbi:MFS transporter [Saccharothrix obliqua]|uniref:MFS transporter n=1 Tax=Saccharothrix obliqua TaxID=2861747 RepID=UPI001C5D444A|nr:MFS transporter [Saccharothrix obliqua]MBW4721395.1 MFS transporter [Saccharothrix obliqua]
MAGQALRTPPAPVATSLRRLVPGLLVSRTGIVMAIAVPLQLLLTIRLTALLDGAGAAVAFGLVTGVGAVVAMALNPITGRISDATTARLGKRRTWLLFGALTGGAALAVLGLATEVWQVVLMWTAVQALFNFQAVATDALFADQVDPARRGRVAGISGLPSLLGPVIGMTLVNLVPAGSATQWLVLAGASAAAGVLGALLVRDTPAERATEPLDVRGLLRSFRVDARAHPAFAWAWLVRFLCNCAIATVTFTAVYLTERFGLSPAEIGTTLLRVVLLSAAVQAVSGLLAGYLSDRWRRQKPFVAVAAVITAVGTLGVVFAPALGLVMVSIAVQAVGFGTFLAVNFAMCVRVLPNPADAGRDLALVDLANSLPQSFVPLLATALIPLGGYRLFFGALTAVGLLGLVALARVPEVDA